MGIALEEIEAASREAAREVAAEEAGKTAYYKALAEKRLELLTECESEIARLKRRNWFFGGTTTVLTVIKGVDYWKEWK